MTLGSTMSTPRSLPQAPPALGVLSIHLDGARCKVGCEFCYLGDRVAAEGGALPSGGLDLRQIEEILARLDYREVAVAVSEPAGPALPALAAIARATAARGKPLAITTTAAVLAAEPGVVSGAQRVNLSVDPRKGTVAARRIGLAARAVKASATPSPEIVLIVSLSAPSFAERLLGGDLRALVELPDIDKVALNALKPPPTWCDRAFWLRACARLAPLLERHLDRRLFLDCYVAARILQLGGCPARPDISPGGEFRSCVYQPSPDFRFRDPEELSHRLAGFVAPSVCPFPIP